MGSLHSFANDGSCCTVNVFGKSHFSTYFPSYRVDHRLVGLSKASASNLKMTSSVESIAPPAFPGLLGMNHISPLLPFLGPRGSWRVRDNPKILPQIWMRLLPLPGIAFADLEMPSSFLT
eukprot:TRINITY_DN1053_c0_g1_i4.p2 TRINITY_DN1053_c0_g1~~TRINITY_DN1053_c0_g1_i4.p2  ORF type:complete len:120 (-),score=2.58 TRINITY_DN1053_c0_g1_i4:71-430(-)